MKYLIFYFFTCILSQPNDSNIVIEKIINIKADKIYVDHTDHLYILSENTLVKYNSKGIKIVEYSPETGTDISYIDCYNPNKILIYFDSQNKFSLLDNNLNRIGEDFQLEDIQIINNAFIINAYDNGYFIYDQTDSRLYKVQADLKVEYHTDLFISDEVLMVKRNKTQLIFKTDTDKQAIYNFISNDLEYLIINNLKGNLNLDENIISYYNEKKNSISLQNIYDSDSISKNIILPENIEVIDAIYQNNKIYFYDRSKVYIAKIQLMKK